MRIQRTLFHRIFIFLFTLFLALTALFVTLNRDVMNIDGFQRWLRYGNLELSMHGESESFSHAGGDLPSFALNNQGVMMVSQVGSRYYTFTGEVLEEKVVSYRNPVLHTGNQTNVLYDAGGQGLSIYGNQEEMFSLAPSAERMVLSARLNQNDWLVMVTQEGGYKGVVTVYNAAYLPVMDISLSTTYIMDAFLSPDSKKLAVITIGQEDGQFLSHLMLYSVGENEPEKVIALSGQVVLDMDYEKDCIWLLCEKELILVNTLTFEQKSWGFSGQYLKDSTLGGDGFATLLLGQYRAGTANHFVTINSSGEVIAEKSVASSPVALTSAGPYIGYLMADQFLIYTSALEEYARLDDVRFANEIALHTDGTALLASKQEAWLYVPG